MDHLSHALQCRCRMPSEAVPSKLTETAKHNQCCTYQWHSYYPDYYPAEHNAESWRRRDFITQSCTCWLSTTLDVENRCFFLPQNCTKPWWCRNYWVSCGSLSHTMRCRSLSTEGGPRLRSDREPST